MRNTMGTLKGKLNPAENAYLVPTKGLTIGGLQM
jgi:hypothetical protein